LEGAVAPKPGGAVVAAAGAPPKFGGGCDVWVFAVPAAAVAGADPGGGVLAGVDPNVKDGCGATAASLLLVPVLAAAENAVVGGGTGGPGWGCGVLAAAVEPNAKTGCGAVLVPPGC
jgi:hypothetical protein